MYFWQLPSRALFSLEEMRVTQGQVVWELDQLAALSPLGRGVLERQSAGGVVLPLEDDADAMQLERTRR